MSIILDFERMFKIMFFNVFFGISNNLTEVVIVSELTRPLEHRLLSIFNSMWSIMCDSEYVINILENIFIIVYRKTFLKFHIVSANIIPRKPNIF